MTENEPELTVRSHGRACGKASDVSLPARIPSTDDWDRTPLGWWGIRLPLYNLALLFAGPAAWFCYLIVIDLFRPDIASDPQFELGGEALALQMMGYAAAMMLANVCYLVLGPALEGLIRPASPRRYRWRLFWIGTAFSVALPFGIPVLVAIGG